MSNQKTKAQRSTSTKAKPKAKSSKVKAVKSQVSPKIELSAPKKYKLIDTLHEAGTKQELEDAMNKQDGYRFVGHVYIRSENTNVVVMEYVG